MPGFFGNDVSKIISNNEESLEEAMTITNCSVDSENAIFTDTPLSEEEEELANEIFASLAGDTEEEVSIED